MNTYLVRELRTRGRIHLAATADAARHMAAELVKGGTCDGAEVYLLDLGFAVIVGLGIVNVSTCAVKRISIAKTKACAACEGPGAKGVRCPYRANHDVRWLGAPKNAPKAKVRA